MSVSRHVFDPDEVLSPEQHQQMSIRLLQEADHLLESRERRLPSRCAWAAVVHQLLAIAEQRGWNHEHEFREIGRYLEKEYDLPTLGPCLSKAQWAELANDYIEVEKYTPQIRKEIANARALVADLEDLRRRPMGPYTIEDDNDQSLVHLLTGVTHPLGTTREHGFMNEARLQERSRLWGLHQPSELMANELSSVDSRTTLELDYDADQDILTLEGTAIESITAYDADIPPRQAVRVYSDEDGVVSHVVVCGAAALLRDVLQAGQNVFMTMEMMKGPADRPEQ